MSARRHRPALNVLEWGDGPPVVFIHGLGASARYWKLVAASNGRYHGIAPDLLGFGRSPKPRAETYDVGAHVAALRPIVPDGSVLVGHSTGAIVATALAAHLAHRAAGLLLVGLPAYRDAATARREIGRLGTLARLTVDRSPAARLMCALMCTFRPVAMGIARITARDVPPAVAADGVRHTWPSYSRTLEHVVVGHRPDDNLAASDCPILFLHGRDDQAASPAAAEAIAERTSRRGRPVEFRVVEGDHHLPLRRPDVVAAAVAELVDRRP